MIPEHFPELFPGGSPHNAKDEYVRVCDALFCISNTTKTDVVRHYGTLDKPVVVTPLGVGEHFFSAPVIDAYEQPFVLFVGQRKAYKNFDVLLRAFSKLGTQSRSVMLMCVGGPAFDSSEVARIANLNLQDRVTHCTLSDDKLPALYASAICFVFPSRYEGFGLPILEAFAAGCPVVLAEMDCSVEVGAGAAQFFRADDDETLAEVIGRLINSPSSRTHWVAEGRKRALDYRWRKTAKLTGDVYRDIWSQYG